MIYADNAATTRMSENALRTYMNAAGSLWGNPSSLHITGQNAKAALEEARARMAALLHCEPREVYFTSGGSESDNQAIRTAVMAGLKKGKNHVISTRFEHHAVLHTLQQLEKELSIRVTLLDVHEDGLVRVEELREAITPETALVSVMYANNEIGTIQPIREIGEICAEKKVLFHTDAVQAVGILDVDFAGEKIDLLSLSAHKFHGPKGVGALIVKRGVVPYTLISGGAQERGKRAGTENLPGILAMVTALEDAVREKEEKTAHLLSLRETLIDRLTEIPYSALNGDRKNRLPGNVNLCFEGIEGESLLLLLDANGIEASSGSACTSGSLDPSHVLLAIGRPHEVAHGSLRLTLSGENTMEDVEKICEILPQVVEYLRSISPVWKDLESGKAKHILG
ncbi:MAG: cysteine desulfurase [Ruminococcaceae bacterium]|nr:cysteine desulfurase [Oscillospiraceae bacterium]